MTNTKPQAQSKQAGADKAADKAGTGKASKAAPSALAGKPQVEALAESLTAAADALRRRLAAELKHGTIGQIDAQTIAEDEAVLRQRANSLHIDAADYVLRDLPLAQDKLLAAVAEAGERIAQFDRIAHIVNLGADLVLLAGALLAVKPSPFLSALKKLKADSAALDKI